MKNIVFYLLILTFFCACQKEQHYYMDLGNEKMREYSVPVDITKFSFLALDKSKIVLQTFDTSQLKLLLDTKTGQISNADFRHLGMKGYLNTEFRVDTLNQRFWHNKNDELELFDVKKNHFYYFKTSPILNAVFTKKYAFFSTKKGLKVFDNQDFRLDSISQIPDWEFEIEYADDESIFINSNQLFNFKTKTITPLTRNQVRERLDNCIYSESKFKRELENKLWESVWNSPYRKYEEKAPFYFEDIKNIYALYKGKITILNKLYLDKNIGKQEVVSRDYKKDSIDAWQLSKFIDFELKIEESMPQEDVLTRYKIYQICTKANNERFGNVYQYVDNPFDLDYSLSDKQMIDFERIVKLKKCPKQYESNVYTKLFYEYATLYQFDKAIKYYKIWEQKYGKNSNFYYNEDLAYVSKIQKEINKLRQKKVSSDVILYKKIQLLKAENINDYAYMNLKNYEWEICQKILRDYPNSVYADDIELGIFNNEIVKSQEDEYNKTVSKNDIVKLKKIIAKYPNSDLKKEFEFAMINTLRCMWRDNAINTADSVKVFNYQIKGAKMLVDFYINNPNFYKCSEDEYKEDCETKQKLIHAKQNLESLKFQQNIRVSLSCPQKEYNRTEPIILTYTIKNVGKEEQGIETNEIDGLAYKCLLFNVLNYSTEGCALDSVIYFQRILKETPKPTKQILKAGEAVNFQIDITKLANLRAKEFSTFENPLMYCHYPNSYGRLEILQPLTLEIYIANYYALTPSNKLLIKIK